MPGADAEPDDKNRRTISSRFSAPLEILPALLAQFTNPQIRKQNIVPSSQFCASNSHNKCK